MERVVLTFKKEEFFKGRIYGININSIKAQTMIWGTVLRISA
jgi:hypothetical protein